MMIICHSVLNRNSITISEESDFLNVSTCFTLNSGAFILTTLNLHFNRIIHATYKHNHISIPSSWRMLYFLFSPLQSLQKFGIPGFIYSLVCTEFCFIWIRFPQASLYCSSNITKSFFLFFKEIRGKITCLLP